MKTKNQKLETEISKIFSLFGDDFLEKYQRLKKEELDRKRKEIDKMVEEKTPKNISKENLETLERKIEEKIIKDDLAINFGKYFLEILKNKYEK